MEIHNMCKDNIANNLRSILFDLKLSSGDFAKDSGISPNTLSNIMNRKFIPSDETIEKIIDCIQKKGFSKDDLFKETISIYNARIASIAPLSGNEKSALCKFFSFWEEKISVAYDLEYYSPSREVKVIPTYMFFDLYTGFNNSGEFPTSLRFAEFINYRDGKNLKAWLKYFLKPEKKTKDLFGLPYYSINITNPVKPDIISLVLSLGIKIGFESFGTKKIKSFSTSLDYTQELYDKKHMTYSSCIIINKDICKTYEQFKYIIAKEFYFMINTKYSSQYKKLDVKNVLLETEITEADFFAEEILLPTDLFLKSWEENKFYTSYVFDKVTRIKERYNVSYKLVLNKIKQNNLFEYSEEQYLDEIKRYYAENDLTYEIVQDEPLPSQLNFLVNDFFSAIFIAAYKLYRLSEKEVCKFLRCTKEDLNNKAHNDLIKDIIEEAT